MILHPDGAIEIDQHTREILDFMPYADVFNMDTILFLYRSVRGAQGRLSGNIEAAERLAAVEGTIAPLATFQSLAVAETKARLAVYRGTPVPEAA